MGKLSVLGAQRVKALTEMLSEKLREELCKIDAPSGDELQAMVNKEFGIDDLQSEYENHMKQAREAIKKLNTITGKGISISENNYGRSNDTDYSKRLSELRQEFIDKPRQQLRDEYKRKEQMLWLCETLEEAKAIVGIQ
ncbi:hypothetical protein [Bacillus wiedmannii]|uniref:hypothetical protein n=1 Tax=Bacillus wiedmannii TaxID=1890302 RepID=UPI0007CA8EDA|nr:hypothetical protein [Bacillus wiedmannii]OAK36253.1 hypothetical protein A6284_26065 [Bacillus wiedmannii]HDR7641335.1 hypothetical protein [Bacillus wiedmannii]